MKTRTMLTIGLSAFALTGVTGGLAIPGMSAIAASAENPKQAAAAAGKAAKAIAKRKGDTAVAFAEQAVGFAPRNAEYRQLLGQAYLLAGRFVSARQTFADVLALDPANGAAALNLALTQIAAGDWNGARATLDTHSDKIPASDRGLAFALAGDPVKAVEILAPAVREADATAKTRQNFALSLALAGRWSEATSVASIDVPPDQLDKRIMDWLTFARPTNAYDQVASLLGVTPVADAGQPAQLALVQGDVMVAAATAAPVAEPVDDYMPGKPGETEGAAAAPAPVEVASVPAETAPEPQQIAGTGPQVVFGPRAEVVQAIPARAAAVEAPAPSVGRKAPKVAAVEARAPEAFSKGNYYVQLGAYVNAAVARDSWRRVSSRMPELGRHTPQGAQVTTKAGNFYRLSVGGFARNDAEGLCRTVKAGGGNCFVRTGAGDQIASWAKGVTRVASR